MTDDLINLDDVALLLNLAPIAMMRLTITNENFPYRHLLEGEPYWCKSEIEEWQVNPNPEKPGRENIDLVADLEELDDIKIHVYKMKRSSTGARGNQMAWCLSLDQHEMSLAQLHEHIAENFGNGAYKIQVREAGTIRKARVIDVRNSTLPDKLPDAENG